MNKHAYLIIAHNEFYILERLLKQIDSPFNDIYLHIDKKIKNVDFSNFKKCVKQSKIFFVERMNVKWSEYSQIKCEYLMLKSATKNNYYSYYHLLSGVDMLLKDPKTIYDFFEKNSGYEFVSFQSFDDINQEAYERIKYYHLLNGNSRNKCIIIKATSSIIHHVFVWLQKKINFNRVKKSELEFRKGANWFSITDDLARYVLLKEKEVSKIFRYTKCADELFLQTIVYNSDFRDKVYRKLGDEHSNIKRYIDWNRGNPYTFKKEDYQVLINSDDFFGRKFSTSIDKEIVDMIYDYCKVKKC